MVEENKDFVGSNLLRYNSKQKFICPDTETENLSLIFGLPWQCSFIEFTINSEIQVHNHYIWWPDLKVSAKAAAITGFNHDLYKERAEDPAKILDKLESILYDPSYKIMSQNYLGFDSFIINNWRRKLGKKPLWDYIYQPFKIYDTVALSKMRKLGIKPDMSSGNNFLSQQYRLLGVVQKGLKTSLGTVGKEFKLELDESKLHDALYDVRLNIEIFKKTLWTIEI